MGSSHSLSEEARKKHTDAGGGHGLEWGVSAMQGHRPTMEDSHTVEQKIDRLPGSSFFAVYDGHAGRTVSTIAATDLLPFIVRELDRSDEAAVKALDPKTIGAAMRKGIMAFDAELFARIDALRTLRDISGSTAIMSIVTPKHIIIANVGDSRAVFSSSGKVVRSTEDHKPQNTTESTRVVEAGGYIMMGRVCGNLAVSRALGDFTYKEVRTLPPEKQKISNCADITIIPRNDIDDFLIVACDGIWDVVTNQQAVSFVSRLRKSNETASIASEKLLDHCLRRGSTDNMSALIVYFPRDASAKNDTKKGSRRFMRGAPRLNSTESVESVASESDLIPRDIDRSRGRGSVSTLEPITDVKEEGAPSGLGAVAEAAEPEETVSGADAGVAKADSEADDVDDEEDIIPMKTDLSRGRGSFVLTDEEAEAKRLEILAQGDEPEPPVGTVAPTD